MALKKISFVGDIMCEPMLMKAAKKRNGYDFSCVFQHISDMFADSDYVIGNLETPLAGAGAGYTNGLFSFNTPDEFADAVKQAGIDMVVTANNHCLDRGIDGLIRTLRILESKGIASTGVFAAGNKRKEAEYFSVGEMKCAVIAYTYGTNFSANHLLLNDNQKDMVNLLRPQQELYYISKIGKRTLKQRAFGKFLCLFKEENRYYIKKALGKTVNIAHTDDNLNKETTQPYIDKLQRDIRAAKEKSDIVLFYPHIGGQFNKTPGVFSEYVFSKAIEAGCDAIIASHAHVVQKAEYIEGIPCFFSLGNFSMSPNSVYLVRENLPEYGLMTHLYLNKNTIEKVSFSILKIIESKTNALTVVPVDLLYDEVEDLHQKEKLIEDVQFIYRVVTGAGEKNIGIEREYIFK